jgi:ASPIC and UnbV/FG-GAP-like repeat
VAWLVGTYDVCAGWGLSWTDFDNDGDLDLYVAIHMHYPSVLLENVGGLFFRPYPTDLGRAVGLDDHMGAWSDYDGDGDLDLFTANGFHRPDHLMQNEQPAPFREVSSEAGITLGEHGRARSAIWDDLDGDSWNDLLVFDLYTPDAYYHSRGDGTFESWSDGKGFANSYGKEGAACGDLDGDGDLDLYLTLLRADQRNVVLLNRGDGSFADRSAGSGADLLGASFSCALGDSDGDGDLDIYLARGDASGDVLLANNGDATFVDVSKSAGIDFVGPGVRGACFADLDNDLDLDVYVSCGGSHDGPDLPNVLLVNHGDGTFERAPAEAGAEALAPGNSAAAAFGDFDRDGWLDIAITNGGGARAISGPTMLLKNRGAPAGEEGAHHWMQVLPEKLGGSRDSNGARVTLRLPDGRTLMREAGGFRHLTQDAPGVHVGLGPNEHVEEVCVRWPDGTATRTQGAPADARLYVTAGRGTRYLGSHPAALLGEVPSLDLDLLEQRIAKRFMTDEWPQPDAQAVAARQDELLAWVLARELARTSAPSAEEIQAWAAEHAEELHRPARLWVEHVAVGKFTEFRVEPEMEWPRVQDVIAGLRSGRNALELMNELGIRAWARVYRQDADFEPNYEIDRDDTTRGYLESGWMSAAMLSERFGAEFAEELQSARDGGVRGPRKLREAADLQKPELTWPLLRAFRVAKRHAALDIEPDLFALAIGRRIQTERFADAVRERAGAQAWPPRGGDTGAIGILDYPVAALARAARESGMAARPELQPALERCAREAALDAALQACATAASPSDEEIRAFAEQRAAAWSNDERTQGTLLFFSALKRAELARDRLAAGATVESLLRELDLPPLHDPAARGRGAFYEVVDYDAAQAERVLGPDGAAAIRDLKPGESTAILSYHDRNHILIASGHTPAGPWEGAAARAALELRTQRAEALVDELLGER